MKISVIIPCFNAAETIGDQLQALLSQQTHFPFEIIVVDNNSTDCSRKVVCSFSNRFPQVKLAEAKNKQGPGHARNVGAEMAAGEVLVFCDADDQVSEGWLAELVRGLEDADLAIGRIEHKRLNKNSWLKAFDIDSDNYDDEDTEEEDHRASFPPHLMMVRGWGLAIKREFHDRVGGFDEELMAAEDLDYGFKAQLLGARVKFMKNAVLHYRLRSTVDEMEKQWFTYGKFTGLMRKRYDDNIPLRKYFYRWGYHLFGWIRLMIWRLKIREKWEMGLFTRNLAFRKGIFYGSLKYRVPPTD